MNILTTTDLTKQYGEEPNLVKALDHVNISIEKSTFKGKSQVVGVINEGKASSQAEDTLGGKLINDKTSQKSHGDKTNQIAASRPKQFLWAAGKA